MRALFSRILLLAAMAVSTRHCLALDATLIKKAYSVHGNLFSPSTSIDAQQFLEGQGVVFVPGGSARWEPKHGRLTVLATQENQELVSTLVQIIKESHGLSAFYRQPASTSISMLRLLAKPEQYAGKRITVQGYYVNDFEGSALYYSREAAENRDMASSAWIDAPLPGPDAKGFKRGFVLITGNVLWNTYGQGHRGRWSVALNQISGFSALKPTTRKYGWGHWSIWGR